MLVQGISVQDNYSELRFDRNMDNTVEKRENVFLNRNFRLVFLGALVSELGAILYNFAVSFYILDVSGNNAFLQGLYLALCGVALLLFTPIGGVLGDRFNKAKIMYICDYLKGGSIILATVLMLVFKDADSHIIILFALGIIGNIVSGIFTPASGALLPIIIKDNQLQQANSFFVIKSSLEGILGIILAGILYATISIYTLFFIVGFCFVASGVSEMLIKYDFIPSEEHLTLKVAVKDMGEGLRYIKTNKALTALLISILFINFFIEPVTGNFLPYFVKTDLAGSESYLFDSFLKPELWSSLISVFFGLSSLIGAIIMSSRQQEDKCGRKTSIRLCVFALVMTFLTISYWQFVDRGVSINGFLIALILGCMGMGLLISIINIPVSTTMMRIVDKDKLSKVNSITSIGSQGMTPIASVLAGLVLEHMGCTPLMAFCSVGFAITAVLMLTNKHVKEF